MSHNLSSAAVVIGALRVNSQGSNVFQPENDCAKVRSFTVRTCQLVPYAAILAQI